MKSTYVKILSCILFFSSIKLFQPFNQTIPIEAQQCQQKSREKNPSILTSLTTNRYDESMALSCVCSFFLLGLLIYLSLFKLTQVSVRRTTNTFQIHTLESVVFIAFNLFVRELQQHKRSNNDSSPMSQRHRVQSIIYCNISDFKLSWSIVSFTAWNTNLIF